MQSMRKLPSLQVLTAIAPYPIIAYRCTAAALDGAVYLVASITAAFCAERLSYPGSFVSPLRVAPAILGLAIYLLVRALSGGYERAHLPATTARAPRRALSATAALLCAAAGARSLGAGTGAIALWIMTPVIVCWAATLPFMLDKLFAHSGLACALAEQQPAPVIESVDLSLLMQRLTRNIVMTAGVRVCRIFTYSTDGGALVLRGAADGPDQATDTAIPSWPPRLRIPVTAVAWLTDLPANGWLQLPPASPAAERQLGLARLLGGAAPDDAEAAIALLRVGDRTEGLIVIVQRSGAAGRGRTRALRLSDAILAAHADAIERAFRSTALRYANSPVWQMLRQLPYGLVVFNTATRVLFANPAAVAALSLSAEELVRRRLCEAGLGCSCPLHTAARTGKQEQLSLRTLFEPIHGAAINRPGSATLWPVRRADGQTELIFMACAGPGETAVTAMGPEVTALIMHDLGTPLASLVAASELALEEEIDPDDQRRLLHQIARQANRLDRLSHELIDSFQLEAGQLRLRPAQVDASQICRDLVADFEDQNGQRHQFNLRAADAPPVTADPAKLRTILRNLIGNAIKYSPAGSTITVTLTDEGDTIGFMVEDEGPGIAVEHLSHIFDQVYQAPVNGARRGHGLGLFSACSLVALHGGRIWATNRSEGGACFRFTLPATSKRSEAKIPAAAGSYQAAARDPRR